MKLRNAAPELATLLFALLLSIDAFAQYRPNVVIWDQAAECGQKKTVNERAKFTCSTEDGNVRIMETDEIKLKIQPHNLPGKVSIRTIIKNKTGKPIKTSHKEWSIAHYASEQDFLSRNAPITNERYIPPPKPVGTFLPSGVRDPTIQRVTTVGSTSTPGYPTQLPAGQQQVVVRPPDTSRNESTAIINRGVSTKQQRVLKGEFNTMKLTEDTIHKQGMVNGSVVFNLYENAKFRLLLIHIGDTSFIFALKD